MNLEIIAVYENLDGYLLEMEKDNADYKELWDEYAIKPYWEKLSQWAPFDMSDRKPKPIKDVSKLKQQIKLLKEMNLDVIRNEFLRAVEALPNYDDDTIVIAIYPLDDNETNIKEQQNGVQGVSIFGNMLIQVNPFAEDYFKWIPYVFAHEYHHSVWGNYWYVVHGGSTGSLIEALLIDGQADSFAKSLNPTLNPKWISQISKEQEKELWDKHYSKLLDETNFDYGTYMFGNEKLSIPWCAGYFFGYRIIDSFRKLYPDITTKALIEINSEEILSKSNYNL
ncbi:DUF2268 domain-containing putative Zn-dependent protease [Clostridium fungisolvens]|uniref:DUF2268 domain-containing protein n=1 Tax=Clostridium fungisolvens TaxID=1604897 RepID=A0A6V8SE64_9CLOT|nr:DUF2268 domain-containing putative Zn-dependent protease [Clostridium fungisolvens]GFP75529.1 hypothetical protein bsdtw1_01613 [Clostridium fungisolvens]